LFYLTVFKNSRRLGELRSSGAEQTPKNGPLKKLDIAALKRAAA
jgi:hypothetical protein